MNSELKNKLVEIFVDKFLIGILILLAGFVANKSIERYKLEEAQRVADTTDYVKACAELWSKLYAFESALDRLDTLQMTDFLFEGPKVSKSIESVKHRAEVVALDAESERLLEEFKEMAVARKFIVGQDVTFHFHKYAGLVKVRARARRDCRDHNNPEIQKNACEVEKSYTQELASMRFNAVTAREMALTRMP